MEAYIPHTHAQIVRAEMYLIPIQNIMRNVNRPSPPETEGCSSTCVIVSVIFLFPGVMACRRLL